MKARRIGMFSIPRSCIDEAPGAVRDCLAGLIVVKAELSFHDDALHYTAIGWPFPLMQSGNVLMHMYPRFHREEDGSVRFDGWDVSSYHLK